MTTNLPDQLRRRVFDLRRTHSLRQVAELAGLPLGTVKTLCSRSGAFRDNPKHRELFTLPPIRPSDGTDLATLDQLPPQVAVTGDKEIDAVLWLRSVISTGQAAHIEKAMLAAERIKTPLADLEKRYTKHLAAKHPGSFGAVFASFGFANLKGLAERSIETARKQQEAPLDLVELGATRRPRWSGPCAPARAACRPPAPPPMRASRPACRPRKTPEEGSNRWLWPAPWPARAGAARCSRPGS